MNQARLRGGDPRYDLVGVHQLAVVDGLHLVMAVLWHRSLRSATIEFRDGEVVLYGLLRNKRIAWYQVREVGVTRGTSAALLPWRVPFFTLDDGSTVLADEIRSLREPSIVDDVVAEARRRLDR
ncbi:MAG: hypothetical protein KDB02_05685 [Acidimicrobiales bacterium]|nr:hypothetical protein [Acidimicrobiales bacterium]